MMKASTISVILLVGMICASCSESTKSQIEGRTTEGAALALRAVDPTCRNFCVRVEQKSAKVGGPISGVISWHNVPVNSVLSLSLDRTDDLHHQIVRMKTENSKQSPHSSTRFDGSLRTQPVKIPKDGSLAFKWSGDGFGCYRSEIAEICPGKAVAGPHVISSSVYDSTTVVHPFSDPETIRNAKPKIIYNGTSSTIEIR